MSAIPGIPQTATGVSLTNHINDRLRRISLALGAAGSPGAAGAAGAPGAAGSAGSGGAAAFTIGVSAGAAKPNLSMSSIQHVVLTANTKLVVPAGIPAGTMIWLLIVDNPSPAPLQLTQDATYSSNASLDVAAGTRMVVSLATTQSGNTVVSSVVYNQVVAAI